MSENPSHLRVLLAFLTVGLLAGTVVGGIHGLTWSRQREVLLERAATQVDAYLVTSRQHPGSAEPVLVYAPRQTPLFIYYPSTERVLKTEHYFALEGEAPPHNLAPPIDLNTAAAFTGGALGGMTAKDLFTGKYGSRPSRALAVLAGAITGYIFGFAIALRYEPDVESRQFRQLLGTTDTWKDLERRFLRQRAQGAATGLLPRIQIARDRNSALTREYLQRNGYIGERGLESEWESALVKAHHDVAQRARKLFADSDSAGDLSGAQFSGLIQVFAAFDTLQGLESRTTLSSDNDDWYEPFWVRYWWLSLIVMILVAGAATYEYFPKTWGRRVRQLVVARANRPKARPVPSEAPLAQATDIGQGQPPPRSSQTDNLGNQTPATIRPQKKGDNK